MGPKAVEFGAWRFIGSTTIARHSLGRSLNWEFVQPSLPQVYPVDALQIVRCAAGNLDTLGGKEDVV